jgi:hypothetical protein
VSKTKARIDRLERQLKDDSAFARKQVTDVLSKLRDSAVQHALILCTIIFKGDPQVGEPLSEAWNRAAERSKEKEKLRIVGFPHDDSWLRMTVELLRIAEVPIWPSNGEKEKVNRVFSSAPPWLLWFTHGDFTARTVKLEIPDLSEVSKFDRQTDFSRWPGLPSGKFEQRLQTDPKKEESLDTDRLCELIIRNSGAETPRKRLKALKLESQFAPFEFTFDWPQA